MAQADEVASVGAVREFNARGRLGVIDPPAVPGGCRVHFSVIAMDGFRHLTPGQDVSFRADERGGKYHHARPLVSRLCDP